MSSLDTNQPIYISEKCRESLFKHILEEEQSGLEEVEKLYEYMFSAENLENYCDGAIRLQVQQYNADGGIVSCGTLEIHKFVKEVQNAN